MGIWKVASEDEFTIREKSIHGQNFGWLKFLHHLQHRQNNSPNSENQFEHIPPTSERQLIPILVHMEHHVASRRARQLSLAK